MIRPADHLARPGHHAHPAQPGPANPGPANPGPAPSGPPPSGPGPDERDASYWYDLPGANVGAVTGTSPAAAPEQAETRGPFEPLVSSSAAAPEAPAVVPEPAPVPDLAPPTRTGNLDQIRESYLTAEAIGEQNVDKHFDHLLAQQRELISEYFKQSPEAPQPGASRPGAPRAGTPQPGAAQAGPETSGGPSEDPRGASVIAEQPRAW